jgi:AcrR family transcriptional regulator
MQTVVNNQTSERQSTRKAQILGVAGRLFEEQGYEKTTLEMIGREVGLSKQSLYYYVASKEAALLEVCRAGTEETPGQRIRRLRDEGLSADAILADYIEVLVNHYVCHPRTGLLARHLNSMSEAIQGEVREEVRQELRALEDVVDLGQRQGLFGDVDVKVAARVLQSAAHGFHAWFSDTAIDRVSDIVTQYQSLLLGGLRSPA